MRGVPLHGLPGQFPPLGYYVDRQSRNRMPIFAIRQVSIIERDPNNEVISLNSFQKSLHFSHNYLFPG